MTSTPPRLRLVTGKGGVGKSTVATALALALARAGQRVLLCELDGGGQAARLLGLAPVGPNLREVLPRLYAVDIEPRAALHEYALLTLRFESLYRAVFENRVMRNFIRLVPALGEIVMLGKVWHHERERDNGGAPRFDCIVVDLPATGHALSLLRAPRALTETVPLGPLHSNARAIDALLRDPARTLLHIVTTPEEMPALEAAEIYAAARGELGLRVGELIVNQTLTALDARALTALGSVPDAAVTRLAHVLRLHQERCEQGEQHLLGLPAALRERAIRLPSIVGETFGRDAIGMLAPHLASVLGGAP